MTDQERIAKLRDGTWDHTIMRGPNPTGFCSDETLFVQETADRIERLVEDRNMACRLLGAATQMQTETQDKLDKMDKAMAALNAAKVYIDDLQSHEGAEGFSASTNQAVDIYYAALAELEGN
jgi:hypothetical protein